MVCFKISFVVKLFVVCFCYSSFDMVLVLISVATARHHGVGACLKLLYDMKARI